MWLVVFCVLFLRLSRGSYVSIQGWRPSQEDSHTMKCKIPGHPSLGFFAVYDGHGGALASQRAATIVIQTFTQLLPDGAKDHAAVETALKAALMQADLKLAAGSGRDLLFHTGCTAIVCVVTPTHIVCGNLGDSRAVLITFKPGDDESGQPNVDVHPLSTDQKPDNEVERTRIVKAGGFVEDCAGTFRVNGDLAVARALGDFSFKDASLPQAAQAVSSEPEMTVTERIVGGPQVLLLLSLIHI